MTVKTIHAATFTLLMSFAWGLNAQTVSRKSPMIAKRALSAFAPPPGDRPASGQYSAQELEDLRTQLLELADTIQDMSAIAHKDSIDLSGLAEARAQIQAAPYQNLNRLRLGISPTRIGSRIRAARESFRPVKAAIEARANARPLAISPQSAGFPQVSGLCDSIGSTLYDLIKGSSGATNPGAASQGPFRIPVEVVLGADVVFFVADSLRELAQDACKEDIAGENTSLVCIPVDIIWIIAKAVDEGIHFCDDDLTGNVIDASFARLDHIHTDLTAHDTRLANVTAAIDAHITSVDNRVNTSITSLDTHLTNVDTKVTTSVGRVQETTNALALAQSSNQALNFRLTVEQELLQAGRGGIGTLELPASAGGYLEEVAKVVKDTLDKFVAAGQAISSARTSLGLAEDAFANRDYKTAFTNYRNAYRLAVQ
jgi:hypothetical protein